MDRLLEKFRSIAIAPIDNRDEWLGSAEKSVDFLKQSLHDERTILFASGPCALIHAALAPLSKLNPPDKEELSDEFVQEDDSWIIQHASGGGKGERVYLEPPLDRFGNSFKGGEKLIFRRSFAGRKGDDPIEISQKLIHSLDLHFLEERHAYCRLDSDGDIEDVIKISVIENHDRSERETFITILTKDFAEYMRLSKAGMVTFFDFTRFIPGSFNGWDQKNLINFDTPDLFYDGQIMPGNASYVNGRLITRTKLTLKKIIKARVEKRNPKIKKYAMFKAISLETKERIEVSCAKEGLRNYFQPKSELPFELSPVFFKPEVLIKYKNDPEKYDLNERSVSCRGTWSLKTFDINDAGQVHTYLVYLRDLPYSEQVYWQSFNEWPKGEGLSKRAIQTDFMGEFSTEYDPLISLKRKILSWEEKNTPSWWKLRGKELRDAVRYPVTESASEWGNELLALDQFVVEGFIESKLRLVLEVSGGAYQIGWRSLKILEEILKARGMSDYEAKSIVGPLRKLHELRTLMKGHSAGASTRAEAEKKAKSEFGNYRQHFHNLTRECDEALAKINDSIPHML